MRASEIYAECARFYDIVKACEAILRTGIDDMRRPQALAVDILEDITNPFDGFCTFLQRFHNESLREIRAEIEAEEQAEKSQGGAL